MLKLILKSIPKEERERLLASLFKFIAFILLLFMPTFLVVKLVEPESIAWWEVFLPLIGLAFLGIFWIVVQRLKK